jgi:hypothetical protein
MFMGEIRNAGYILIRKPKGRDQLEDLCMGGRMVKIGS